MPALLLECLTPFVVLSALFGVAVASMHKRPDLWPPSLVTWERAVYTRGVATWERVQAALRGDGQQGAALNPMQVRVRQARSRMLDWAASPGNQLTLYVAASAAIALLVGLLGLAQPQGSVWNRFAVPIISVTLAIVVLDWLHRRRADLLEKHRVIRQMGSRSNPLALDAARIVVERNWHRDGSLAGVGFERADLRGLTLSSAHLARASFMYAGLRDSELMFANLRDARLGSADLRSANLSFSDLENAVLGLADLENASLGRCSLREAHLEGANLRDAFLEHADLAGVHLEQAIYNGKTRWPQDFAPPATAINWDTLGDAEREWFRQWRWYLSQDADEQPAAMRLHQAAM